MFQFICTDTFPHTIYLIKDNPGLEQITHAKVP